MSTDEGPREFASCTDRRLMQMNKAARKNVIGYVLEDAKSHGGIEKNWNFILGDFVLVIVAGRLVRWMSSGINLTSLQRPGATSACQLALLSH